MGNQDDFDDALGYETEKVAKDVSFDIWLGIYTKMLRQVANDYPNLKLIGTQLRGALSADRINWGAVLYDVEQDTVFQAAVRENIEIAVFIDIAHLCAVTAIGLQNDLCPVGSRAIVQLKLKAAMLRHHHPPDQQIHITIQIPVRRLQIVAVVNDGHLLFEPCARLKRC